MKLVIVGGVAGGASAAARARRLDEGAEIVLLERGPDVSFANCGLPYYLGGEITDRDKLLVTPLGRLRTRYKLDARPLSEVTSIDLPAKEVVVRDIGKGTTYRERFDKLILSPGAAPRLPGVPGQELPGVHTLRNLQDADRIMARLQGGVRRAVIMGGGFIGLEMAECLAHRGVAVTLIERNPQVLMALDPEIARPVADELAARGIEAFIFDGERPMADPARALASTTHLLSSVPAEEAGDPVLARVRSRDSNILAASESCLDNISTSNCAIARPVSCLSPAVLFVSELADC